MSKLIFTQLKKMNEKKLFYSMQFLGVEPLLFDTLYKIHVHIHVHEAYRRGAVKQVQF